ncbi:MAG: response regulator [Planctomycetota bacterium]|jgi:two-component system chemotaxis response regulator CheY
MGLKVLIIDDSSLMRKMINRAIRQCAVEVAETFEAENGQEGLQALASHSPDLILCDWNMPVMDGIAFVTEARKSVTTPIIMLTTEGTDSKKAEAMGAGASGYVTKPFTPEKLEEAIKRSTAA